MRKPESAVIASAVVGIFAILLCTRAVGAYPGEALGPEWRVDEMEGQSAFPAVAMAEDGRHLIVYLSELPDGSGAIPARFQYGPDELPSQSGTLILAQDGTIRTEPDAAMSKYGLSLAVSERSDASGLDLGIHGRFYGRFLDPLGDEVEIGDVASATSRSPAVSTDAYGLRYAIAWSSEEAGSHRLRARAFGSDMRPLGGSLALPTYDTSAAFAPSVASTHDQGYYVAWRDSRTVEGARYESVRVQRVRDGVAVDTPILVTEVANAWVDRIGSQVAIAARDAGDFVVVWQSLAKVYARRFDAAGASRGAEMLVSGSTLASLGPHVADLRRFV